MPSLRPEPAPNGPQTPIDEARRLYEVVREVLKKRLDGLEPPDMWTQSVTITAALLRIERAIATATNDIVKALHDKK